MIDLHSHVLPGLDDGARTSTPRSRWRARWPPTASRVVCGTPHVRDDYPTSVEAMEEALARVRAAVADGGDRDRRARRRRDRARSASRARRHHAGAVRARRQPDAPVARDALLELAPRPRANVRPAAPRRHRARARASRAQPVRPEQPELLEAVVRAGAYVQLTAASVDGRLGRSGASCARKLLELELAHCIASDAHGPGVREAGMSAAAEAVGGGEMARWLTYDVPAALLGIAPRRRGRRCRGAGWCRVCAGSSGRAHSPGTG